MIATTQHLQDIGLSEQQITLVAEVEQEAGTEQGARKYLALEEGVRSINTDDTYELCSALYSRFGNRFDWSQIVKEDMTWNG